MLEPFTFQHSISGGSLSEDWDNNSNSEDERADTSSGRLSISPSLSYDIISIDNFQPNALFESIIDELENAIEQ